MSRGAAGHDGRHSTPRHRAETLPTATATAALMVAAHIGPAGTWLPGVRRALFPALAGRGRPNHIALTFDDGPDPGSTPQFLDALDELAVRATFFVLGDSVMRHPRTAYEISRRGHELAVHGWTHSRPWLPTVARDLHEVEGAARVVRRATGAVPRWYRPPYGVLTGGRGLAAARAGLRPVLWTAWGRDWTARATPASVLATVCRDLRGGGTVLLHDSDRAAEPGCWRATLGALPALVRVCRDEGWTVGPLADHGIGGG
ncbi:secreted deacetylase [Streptomyces bingchenggensis BCW-1]|uniref:Secreted deacetylase n=1 Tax=Streptomyces bingchenggensis (strain BCW-1) TaxID=749414 RepID=D7C628_STRBB|nr:secreted deacetylase [Streptomyces bingchenggensis BCW-1]